MTGEFLTISAALDAAARSDAGIRFHNGRGAVEHELSYADLRDEALAVARRLSGCGLGKGDRVAIVADMRPEFLALFYGCQYAGVIPCPLPSRSNLGGLAVYAEKLATSLAAGRICAAITLPGQTGLAEATAQAGVKLLFYDDLMQQAATSLPPPPGPDDIAYIQFSSGSTAQPKGILITQRAVSANVAAILTHGLRLTPEDRAFSWLPFYHDMGLVGFSIAPVYGQCPIDYLPALSFARRPVLWLRLMADYGSTITYAPSFGYRLAAQRYLSEPASIDLTCLRVAGIGGDMIRADILDFFAHTMQETGFRRQAFLPSYGMAEATLAITFADAGAEYEVDMLPAPDNASEPTRRLVSCGFPLPGVELKIAGKDGLSLPDRQIGHIFVRGPNLMAGYADNPQGTAAVMRPDGFLDTGDLGYLRNGQLVVTGRAKDLILFRGRNVWPEDIEWTAERTGALSHGEAVAFSIDNLGGDDSIVLLVQARRSVEELSGLEDRLHRAVSQTLGISCTIRFVAPGSLPKTSSGKLARSKARELYLDGVFG